VRLGVDLVVELVREDGAGRFGDDALGDLDVVVRMVGRHGGRRDDDLGAERLEQRTFSWLILSGIVKMHR